MILDKNYWNNRWETRDTGWDIGYPSPAIVKYMEQIEDKNIALLIPGCGNGYEAEFLVKNGFTNITLIDIAPEAVLKLRERFSEYPQVKVICGDFFQHEGQYDMMIEQTFFCAIPVSMRPQYAQKTANLLRKKGKIIGLMFHKTFLLERPPYGGSPEEYRPLLTPYFDIKKMEACYNSIPSRQGTELFIILEKIPSILQRSPSFT
jgi:methyl halide transferase